MTRRIFILLAAVTIATAAAGQTRRMAVTALSENMMRAMPDYESALETQSLMGTVVEIVGEQGYWRLAALSMAVPLRGLDGTYPNP